MSIAALTQSYKLSTKKNIKINQGWKKLPEGKLMINVDATFNVDSGMSATSVIIKIHGEALWLQHILFMTM